MAHHTWTDGLDDITVVASDGARLQVFTRKGDPDLLPVVLLHGVAQTRRFWGPTFRHLPPEWPLAIVDQRGHGDSDVAITEAISFQRFGADVGAVLDHLDWEQAVVVGHSWGGAVALTTAALYPDRVISVVAIDGGLVALQDLGDRAVTRRKLTPPDKSWDAARLPGLFARSPIGPWLTDDVTAALMAAYDIDADGQARSKLGFERHMHILDGMLDEHPEEYLSHITSPAWVVIAEPLPTSGDPYATDSWASSRDAAVERAVGLLEQPRVVRITGALHDVPLQYPNLVAGVVASAHDEAVLFGTARKGAPAS